jgi:hypothetical protein
MQLDATGELGALVATSTDRRLRGFEWAWDGSEHVYISADIVGSWPFGFAVESPGDVEHTPQAFASFLSELYADPWNVRLLRRVWAQHPVRQLSAEEVASLDARRVQHLAWLHAHRADRGDDSSGD